MKIIGEKKRLCRRLQSTLKSTIKENKEITLRLGTNMTISFFQPDLFPVREATLEAFYWRSYILIHKFKEKNSCFSFTDTESPRVGVYVVVQFYTWFKFYYPLFSVMLMYDNVF